MEILVILNISKEAREKVFGRPELSVSRKMMDRALSKVDGQVWITYQPDPKDETVKEKIDLWEALREYIGRLSDPDTQYYTWTPEDKARYAV